MGLIASGQTRDEWSVLVTNQIMGHKSVAAYDINTLFPLYLYPDPAKPNLWDAEEPSSAPGGRRPNLAPAFIRDFSARLGLAWVSDGGGDREAGTFGPEDVFDYLYAVFHAPEYRERYAEFLKTDFPRLPLTSNAALFWSLRDLGARLVALHLMERAGAIPAITRYPIPGDNVVEKVRYVAAGAAGGGSPDLTPYPPLPQERGDQNAIPTDVAAGRDSGSPPLAGEGPGERSSGRVYINATQYFDGVPPEVWEFHVGGYQVCEKWLKDRRGRALSYDDQVHYQRIVAALAETIRLMAAIDETIEDHGGWPLE